MDQLVIEVMKQAPALGVLVWLVVVFLTKQRETQDKFLAHIDSADVRQEQRETNANVKIEAMMNRATSAIEQGGKAIAANSELLRDVREWMERRKDI